MLYILFFVIALILVLIAIQDFKLRAVSWFLFPILFVLCIIRSLNYIDIAVLLKNFSLNALFTVIQLGIVYIYFAIKKGKFFKTFKKAIGLGDILFFIIICLNFCLINYIVFQIISLLLILLSFGFLRLVNIAKRKLIPLAGGMAIALLALFCLQDIIKILDLYNCAWINILLGFNYG